ncbi:MAG: glycosyltransferase family 4 protein [Bdellovibrionales bacterium]|nr:glycosyltransferase family 4 protein [Bdellovibrionales bacterium]
MKVAIVYNTAWYIYNFRRNLIRRLQAGGATVHAICPPGPFFEALQDLGVICHPIALESHSKNPLTEIRTFIQLYRALAEICPDAVLSFTIKCNLYCGLMRNLLSYQLIANVTGLGRAFDRPGIFCNLICRLYRFSLRRANTVFFQNSEDKDLFAKLDLLRGVHSEVLPGSGVDIKEFRPSEDSAASNSTSISSSVAALYSVAPLEGRSASEKHPLKFLMFGRLLPKKGYDDFLSAAHLLKQTYGEKVEFQILGPVVDSDPESIQLLARIERAAIAGEVLYLGQSDSVLPIIRQADVVVLPSSYNEGVPRSLLEAIACGKPVITTDWKGCRETVVPNRNGFLVPVGDVSKLVQAINSLIAATPEKLKKMGTESRKLAESKFDENFVLQKYEAVVGLMTS